MRSQCKAHSNNFKDHLNCKDTEENKVSYNLILQSFLIGIIDSQKYAINYDNQQNYSVKPSLKIYIMTIDKYILIED